MRNLQTKGIFIMSRLIMLLNSKEELENIASKVDKSSDINSVGYEMFSTISGECVDENSKKKIYEFLPGSLEIRTEEVETMNSLDLLEKPMKAANADKWKFFLSKAP